MFLIGLQHLDFNDPAAVEEIRKINPAYGNAIAHDVADRGNALAEKIGAADGNTTASAVAKVLLMSSLSSAETPLRGLTDGELVEMLVYPLLSVSEIKTALQRLQGQAWYLFQGVDQRVFFGQTANVTAEITDIAANMADEQVDQTLREKLREVFTPHSGALYGERIAILPAPDEIALDADRPTLVILEQSADKLPEAFNTWWERQELQNRVLVLTADRNAISTLRTSARRKAGSGQTLTALGSYWKGRKPLILVRAVVLGCLLPATDDPAADLEVFLKLMAMDDAAFGRRFDGGPTDFAGLFPAHAPTIATNRVRTWIDDQKSDEQRRDLARHLWEKCEGEQGSSALVKAIGDFARKTTLRTPRARAEDFAVQFPELADAFTVEIELARWRRRADVPESERQRVIAEAFATLPYAERLKHVRRPEDCDEAVLLAPIWPAVNRHLGVQARSLPELVEQLGIARFGHRPKVADTFCGGGSIPFEAARLGCDVYASDLNPIACMLTWGAFNIIGASREKRVAIEAAQREVAAAVDAEITRLGIEHDAHGNRAKAYLYCMETRCPRSGWMVPMAPSWVISKQRNVVAKLHPDAEAKRYDIEIVMGVSAEEMAEAAQGTVREGRLVHPMNPDRTGVAIKTIRGDRRDAEGATVTTCASGRSPTSCRGRRISFRSDSTVCSGSRRSRFGRADKRPSLPP